MSGFLHRLRHEQGGGSAAEFALVLPFLILLIFGTIDVGRLMLTWNQAEKATQMGARLAVVTDVIPSGMTTYSYAISGGIQQGTAVPSSSFGGVTCTSASCTCKSQVAGSCPFALSQTNGAFQRIVNRVQAFKPDVAAANVVVEYDYSGLGYAGDPNGPDVAPMVTVKLQSLTFRPYMLSLFGGNLPLPSFRTTLSMEDGAGSSSN